jgi:tetratricopeptide (TPR) repeat protein
MMKFLTTFMVAVCCLAQDPMDLVRHAYELQQAGDYAAAADAYREFLKVRPDEVGAHSNLGVVLTKLGRYGEAITEYQAAEKLAPGDPRIGLNLALAYEKSGRITDARDKLEQLRASSPQEMQITMLLADCDLRLGENGKVIGLLEPVEAQNPNDLAVAYMLGAALIREKRVAEGQRLINLILQNGDTAESRFLLGSQMFAAGDYPNAVKQFASAIALNPNLPELQAYYGQALLLTGDPDGAGAAFRRELASDPNNFAANLSLAQILTERKQWLEAKPYANKSVLLRPGSAEALMALGEYQFGTGRYQDARTTLEKAATLDPRSPVVHQDLASVYSRLHLASAEASERRKAKEFGTPAPDAGPKPNDLAPDFTLAGVHSAAKVHLAAYRGSRPVVLVFGSYTCPNFRSAAPSLDRLFDKYGQSVAFLLVYIREAHGSTSWQSTRNDRDNINLEDAATISEKQRHATLCTRKLNMKFPAVVDGMDGKVEHAYAAWPSRAFVLGKDGRILYSTRLTELDFHSDEMDAAIQQAAGERIRASASGSRR